MKRELLDETIEETETNPEYRMVEVKRELDIPGFEDKITRFVFDLYWDEAETPMQFGSLRGLKKRVTSLLRTWRKERGIAVGTTNTNAPTPERIQRTANVLFERLNKLYSQGSECELGNKILKKLDAASNHIANALELMEEKTEITNESIVQKMNEDKEKRKAALAKAREEKKNSDSDNDGDNE